MEEKEFCTDYGKIYYWINEFKPDRKTLIFFRD